MFLVFDCLFMSLNILARKLVLAGLKLFEGVGCALKIDEIVDGMLGFGKGVDVAAPLGADKDPDPVELERDEGEPVVPALIVFGVADWLSAVEEEVEEFGADDIAPSCEWFKAGCPCGSAAA